MLLLGAPGGHIKYIGRGWDFQQLSEDMGFGLFWYIKRTEYSW